MVVSTTFRTIENVWHVENVMNVESIENVEFLSASGFLSGHPALRTVHPIKESSDC